MALTTNTIRKFIFAEFALLVLAFLVGMYVNLYSTASFPLTSNLMGNPSIMVVMAHIALGILVFVFSLLIFGAFLTTRKRKQVVISLVALLFVVLAAGSGIMFAFISGQDYWSYSMAVGFILSLAVYGALLSTVQSSLEP